ncbi:MAG: hypothetical protein QG575_206 [Euryarchaeota archaeon]|nr:hypothetical protein [Euryarchaeota archaeon]
MQKNLVSLICTLALLAFLMPATIAEDSQDATANTTLNETKNITANITLNETQNVTAIIAANETQNVTESLKPAANPDATATTPPDNSLESAPAATQLGAGKALSHSKVLRAGFEKTKPLNNLDVYGNKSTYNIPFSTSPSAAFNVSSRLGNVSQFTYNTDNYKPLYNISQYSRTKPLYEVPNNLGSKPVYSISGYPEIKTANSIP